MFPAPDRGGYRKFGYKLKNDAMHLGNDFNCPVGTLVKAVSDGEVIDARQMLGFGSLNPSTNGGAIFIKHKDKNGNYFIAIYGHLSYKLKKGDVVKEGDTLGIITPFTNGGISCPHLHFGVYIDDKYPPAPYGYSIDIGKWVDSIAFIKSNLNPEPYKV